ncbi:hypothetical protein P5673_020214 [Acropora cervicornis]|uniref:Uncharacterized protein n=1 Tax=Acropora cervicornis TaxID=6130 RepID=A0AAD9V186_ACRCE|nr:hypothetical protein P5673_020214 [Acropora cervicornis]
MSVSGTGQASGSSTSSPLYTSTIPLAKPPDPLNLEDRSRRARTSNWDQEGVQMFDTFTLDEASHESADNLDHVLAKNESPCLPQHNETYARYLFNKSLIRDRLILGIKNDRVRKKLLEQKDLTLDKALDILRTAELAEIRASEISTEEANVNRVKPRKTKSPNSRTENNKSPMQTMVKQQIPPFKPKAKGALCKISATPVRSSECKFCGTAHEMKKSACPAVGKKRIT